MRKVFLFGLLILLFSACSKESKNPDTKSLVDQHWYLTSIRFTENGKTMDDPVPACQKDDFILFKADRSVSQNYGTDKCSSDESGSANGVWSYDSEKQRLIITMQFVLPPTDRKEYRVTELSSTRLGLETELQGLDGKIVVHYSYQAK